ncbi:DNA replication complex GINS protein PSF3-like [Ruditapes philippinarum]|uniref:DNA replication complex GINS protein PSF3-like n=1 Tax=Ruditapes philippinarum TaxID=129788 RepID=UPI00295AF6F2|nr:DNA replication complex GINS protein PSF3-like [Ruditapes philippinarum]
MALEAIDDYYDLNDILSTNEKLPCKIEMPIYRLGYLDSSSTSEHLNPGTKIELPYWMARSLCSRKRHMVSVELPKNYRESYREILTADASVVDLHKLGPFYYSFGTHLLKFELPDSPDVAKILVKAFQARFRKVMDSSQNAYNEDTTKLTEKLDESERLLFKAGQLGLNDFMRWETRQTEKLTTSEMVKNHRKRKRAVMEDVM